VEHRKLGSSDLYPSVIGVGGYPFGPPLADQFMTTRVLNQARESGVNYIDTSDIYAQGQSEVQIGEAIEGHRDDFILATKFNLSNLGDETPRQRIMRKIDESLTKLKTDHIELYQIHHVAKDISAEEILQPLDELVKAGKIRYVGNCNYSSWRQMEAMHVARDNNLSWFVSTQNHYNMIFRHVELEILPFCNAYETGFIPYFPLASGLLTGKYRRDEPLPEGTRMAGGLRSEMYRKRYLNDKNWEFLDKLEGFAAEREHAVTDLAFAYLLASPVVPSVIAGATKPGQVHANARSAEWRLTDDDVSAVRELF